MQLKEILSIAGTPGLWKFVAQARGGIIVQSLTDNRRTLISGAAKVSALGDIAIYTDNQEVPLAEIFTTIFKNTKGQPCDVNKQADEKQLVQFMTAALPNYDQSRVHISDIRKLALWFNVLVAAGMTEFLTEEDVESAGAETAAAATPVAAKKTAQPAKSTPKATTKPKMVASKGTTNRKSQ